MTLERLPGLSANGRALLDVLLGDQGLGEVPFTPASMLQLCQPFSAQASTESHLSPPRTQKCTPSYQGPHQACCLLSVHMVTSGPEKTTQCGPIHLQPSLPSLQRPPLEQYE